MHPDATQTMYVSRENFRTTLMGGRVAHGGVVDSDQEQEDVIQPYRSMGEGVIEGMAKVKQEYLAASPGSPGPDRMSAKGAPIRRHRLLERMSVSPRPRLIVVQGPAGFGKTSLLRQHCENCTQNGEAVAWVRMDAQSADGAQFLRLIWGALAALKPQDQRKVQPDPESPPGLQDVVRDLESFDQPVVLVVDNFDSMVVPDFDVVFAQLVRSLPESVQLCVGTRVIPSERMARLQLRDGTLMIANEYLCFRLAESMEFFAEFSDLSPAEITEIHERTQGWPAALQAFRLCLRRGGRFRGEAWAGQGITRELMDFLSAEMFEQLAPGFGTLLIELAIPEKLAPGLVEHITGEARGTERLQEIERAGLFLAQADMEGKWMRFHNLFRQFLLRKAATIHTEAELKRRHLRIADWYEAQGHHEEAILHWLEAGATDRAAENLAGIIDDLVAHERLGLIESYADRLPSDAILEHEPLFRGVVIAYSFRRAFDKAKALLEQHAQILDQSAASPLDRGMHDFAQLFLLAAQDRVEELGECAERNAEFLKNQEGWSYGVTFNARALKHVGLGEYEKVRSMMLRARPLHEQSRSLFGRAYQDAIYSMSLSGQGRIQDAAKGLEVAVRQTETRAFGSVLAGSVTAAYLVSNYYELGRFEDARRLIEDYGVLAEQQSIADAVASMNLSSARLAYLDGRQGDSEEYLERMLYLGYRYGLTRLVHYAHAEFARQATLDGKAAHAERWLRELPDSFRDKPSDGLLFHAGENEANNITWIRWLLLAEDFSSARRLLTAEIRRAAHSGRRRRELKLQILMARLYQLENKTAAAGRHMLRALEIGAEGPFIRSFLDEGEALRPLYEPITQQEDCGASGQENALVLLARKLLELSGAAQVGLAENPAESSLELMEKLTEKEQRLLKFVAAGLSNQELAARLSVSINTVKWHLRNIFQKLQIRNRVQAIALARRHGLIN